MKEAFAIHENVQNAYHNSVNPLSCLYYMLFSEKSQL